MNYNANHIQLYLSGKMAAAEMHDFEEAMMNDPMLADAVDGYSFEMNETDIKNDLTHLSQQINAVKAAPAKIVKGSFKQWMSIAAGLIVLLSTSVVLYRIFYDAGETKSNDMAVVSQKDTVTNLQETKVDSNTIAINDDVNIPNQNTSTPAPVIIPSAREKKSIPQTIIKNEQASVTAPVLANEQVLTEKPSASIASNKDNTTIKSGAAEIKSTTDKKTEPILLNKFAGRVVDEQNNPLPFANVTERTSGVGTYADINGNFVMLSSDSILTVQTKSIGYSNTVTQIKSSEVLKIVLKDETIVTNAPSAEVLYYKNKSRSSKQETEADELEAEPAVGWGNYNTYIANNLKEPAQIERKQASISKKVELLFDVNPDGTLTNIKVKRSNCNQCNQEAIRILKEGPRWKSKTGRKETTRFTVQF